MGQEWGGDIGQDKVVIPNGHSCGSLAEETNWEEIRVDWLNQTGRPCGLVKTKKLEKSGLGFGPNAREGRECETA